MHRPEGSRLRAPLRGEGLETLGQVEYAVMSFARSEFGFQRGKLYCLGVGCRFWT